MLAARAAVCRLRVGASPGIKGGTSLSKVYGVIDRFSEDIDLSISPVFIGADEAAFEATTSRTKRDALLAHMQAACGDAPGRC